MQPLGPVFKSIRTLEEDSFNPPDTFRAFTTKTGMGYGTLSQAQFNSMSCDILHRTVDRIREVYRNRGNLEECFFELNTTLGNYRHWMALQAKDKNADQFGRLRTQCDDADWWSTGFADDNQLGQYEQAAKTLWQLFQKALAAHTPPNTCLSVEETPTDVFTVKILTPDDELNFVKMQGYEQRRSDLALVCEKLQIKRLAKLGILKCNEKHEVIWHANTTEQKIIQRAVRGASYILGIRELKTGEGKRILMTQYLACLVQRGDKFELDARYVAIELFHTPKASIPELTPLLAKRWVQIVLWDKKDTRYLNELMTRFTHRYAHTMPQSRGSGWALQVHIKALYMAHWFHIIHFAPGVQLDVKSLECPHEDDLVKHYVSLFELDPTSIPTPQVLPYPPNAYGRLPPEL